MSSADVCSRNYFFCQGVVLKKPVINKLNDFNS